MTDTVPEREPHRKRDERDAAHRGHEYRRHLVGCLLDRGFRAAGILYHLDYLGQRAVLADLLRAQLHAPRKVERRRGYSAPDDRFDGYRFARYSRLVERCRACGDNAVARHVLARHDDHGIADADIVRADGLRPAVAYYRRGVRTELHQLFNFRPRLALRARFEQLAERDERQYHRRRLEKQIHRKFARADCIARRDLAVDQKRDYQPVDIRRARAERYERVHVRAAMQQCLSPADKEPTVYYQHGRSEYELYERERRGIDVRIELAHRESRHVSHGKIHKRQHERERREKPNQHRFRVVDDLCRRGRIGFYRFAAHRCAVARRLHRRYYIAVVKLGLYGKPVKQKIDVHVLDTEFSDRLFHMSRASRAGHSRYVEYLFHSHLFIILHLIKSYVKPFSLIPCKLQGIK